MNPKNYCFCELAPLYALDMLDDEGERRFVEEQIAEFPELGDELAAFQEAAAAISYTVPTVPMADDLKDRLFSKIGLESPNQITPSQPIEGTGLSNLFVRSQDLDWQPYRIPGVTIKRLHLDTVRREVTSLLRAEAGVSYPIHRHAGVEEIFMLEGDLVIGEEVYSKGDYIRSTQGSTHAPETRGGCIFFVRTSVDDEYPELLEIW
jgi:ChrR Cupin-like domain